MAAVSSQRLVITFLLLLSIWRGASLATVNEVVPNTSDAGTNIDSNKVIDKLLSAATAAATADGASVNEIETIKTNKKPDGSITITDTVQEEIDTPNAKPESAFLLAPEKLKRLKKGSNVRDQKHNAPTNQFSGRNRGKTGHLSKKGRPIRRKGKLQGNSKPIRNGKKPVGELAEATDVGHRELSDRGKAAKNDLQFARLVVKKIEILCHCCQKILHKMSCFCKLSNEFFLK